MTIVVAAAVLLAPFGSDSFAWTVDVLLWIPAAVARTRIVTTVDAPLASDPIGQAAACAVTSQAIGEEEMNETFDPSDCSNWTEVAFEGPWFVTVTV